MARILEFVYQSYQVRVSTYLQQVIFSLLLNHFNRLLALLPYSLYCYFLACFLIHSLSYFSKLSLTNDRPNLIVLFNLPEADDI